MALFDNHRDPGQRGRTRVLASRPPAIREHVKCPTCGSVMRFVAARLPDGTPYGRMLERCPHCHLGEPGARPEVVARRAAEAAAFVRGEVAGDPFGHRGGKRPKVFEKGCARRGCGARFTTAQPSRKFCSDACYAAEKRARERESKRASYRTHVMDARKRHAG